MTDYTKTLSKGQLAYEQQRAAKAGLSLDEWMKTKAQKAEAAAEAAAPKPPKKKGFFSRWLDKAHQPLS